MEKRLAKISVAITNQCENILAVENVLDFIVNASKDSAIKTIISDASLDLYQTRDSVNGIAKSIDKIIEELHEREAEAKKVAEQADGIIEVANENV